MALNVCVELKGEGDKECRTRLLSWRAGEEAHAVEIEAAAAAAADAAAADAAAGAAAAAVNTRDLDGVVVVVAAAAVCSGYCTAMVWKISPGWLHLRHLPDDEEDCGEIEWSGERDCGADNS